MENAVIPPVESGDKKPTTSGQSLKGANGTRIQYHKEFLVHCFRNPACKKKPESLPDHLEITLNAPRINGMNPYPPLVPYRPPHYVNQPRNANMGDRPVEIRLNGPRANGMNPYPPLLPYRPPHYVNQPRYANTSQSSSQHPEMGRRQGDTPSYPRSNHRNQNGRQTSSQRLPEWMYDDVDDLPEFGSQSSSQQHQVFKLMGDGPAYPRSGDGYETGPTYSRSCDGHQGGPMYPRSGDGPKNGSTYPRSGDVYETGPTYPRSGDGHQSGPTYPRSGDGHQSGPTYPRSGDGYETGPTYPRSGDGYETGPTYPRSGDGHQNGPTYPRSSDGHQNGPTYPRSGDGHQNGPTYPRSSDGHQNGPTYPRSSAGYQNGPPQSSQPFPIIGGFTKQPVPDDGLRSEYQVPSPHTQDEITRRLGDSLRNMMGIGNEKPTMVQPLFGTQNVYQQQQNYAARMAQDENQRGFQKILDELVKKGNKLI